MLKRILELILSGQDRFYFPDGPVAMNTQGTPVTPNVNTVSQASVASLANVVSFFATPLSGAAAVTGFRLPRGFRGLFAVIPSGAMTGVTGGTLAYDTLGLTEDIPIAVGFACAANKAALFITDGAKVYPTVLTAAG